MLHSASHLERALLVTPRRYREIRQRPDHGVTAAPDAAAVRAAGISCHGRTEARDIHLMEKSAGDEFSGDFGMAAFRWLVCGDRFGYGSHCCGPNSWAGPN